MREANRAFNDMQTQIQSLIKDRTQMLTAISHDLRKPINLLRLCAEFVGDEAELARMFAMLDDMESMISAVLTLENRQEGGLRATISLPRKVEGIMNAGRLHAGHAAMTAQASGRGLKISAWLTGVYFVIELAIGLHTGSVAVISDAFHTFSAVGGIVLAMVAARIALRPADMERTFGSFRAEIVGAKTGSRPS